MRRFVFTLGIFMVLTANAEAALEAGFASVDVTPPLKNKKLGYLAGFGHGRRATDVRDPIMARGLVLKNAQQKIALVCVDVVGLFLPFVDEVRSQLPEFAYIMISATHNHEGPDTLGMWGSTPFTSGQDEAYLKSLQKSLVQVIKDAERHCQQVTAEFGLVHAPELLNDSRLPLVIHDELVAIQFTRVGTRKPHGLLLRWNCHPETLGSKNTSMSSDFVASTVAALSEKYQCPVAYFTGTVGGLLSSLKVPIKDEHGTILKDGTFAKTEAYGRMVARTAEQALKQARPIRLEPFTIQRKQILVPIDNRVFQLGWSVGVLKRPIYIWEGSPDTAKPKPAQNLEKRTAIRTEVAHLQLGELDLAIIPGEIYSELVLDKVQDPADPNADFPTAPKEPGIHAALASKYPLVIGLGNDEIGYIIPKRQWDEQSPYCYGLKQAQYGEINSCGPETAPIICATLRSLVRTRK